MLEHLRRRTPSSNSLVAIISEVRSRWRFKLLMRGAVGMAGIAFLLFLLAASGMEWARFSPASILAGRVILLVALIACALWFLVRPLRRQVTDEQVAMYLEEHEPTLQATLISAVEASREGKAQSAALVKKVVEQAIERCTAADAPRKVEQLPLRRYATALGVVGVVAILAVWFGPSFVRSAGAALFALSGADVKAAVPYRITVAPGTKQIHKGADQVITATLSGFDAEDVVVHSQRAPNAKWETAPLVPKDKGAYEGMIFDVAAPLEYYIEANGVKSEHYHLTVVELPYVEKMEMDLHYPAYTGMEPQKIEDAGGDVAVVKGTQVLLKIKPTMKTTGGRLMLNDKQELPLALQTDGTLTGSFTVDMQGFYRIDLTAPNGEPVQASPQYTIDVIKDQPPTVTFKRPGRDTSVSAIEEVFVEAAARDDYGVRDLELVYSVNGGQEKVVKLFDGKTRLAEVNVGHTLYMEELGVQTGDIVSYYARATDNDSVSGAKKTLSDLYFLNIRPFKKEFRGAQSQANQGGGGGGGGGGGQNQPNQLSQKQKEVIAATHNLERDRAQLTPQKLRENAATIARAQAQVREQVGSAIKRFNSELVERDPAFAKIGEMLPQAAKAMEQAEGKLSANPPAPDQAKPLENQALRVLQKMEEEFQLQISVSRGQQGGGGGGGGGGQMQQELAELFQQDQLQNMASRYETQAQSSQDSGERKVDELAEKMKELSRRAQSQAEQQRLRAIQGQQGGSGAQGRALAEQIEETARQLERLSKDQNLSQQQRQDALDQARRLQDAANLARQGAAGNQAAAQAAADRLNEVNRRLQQGQADQAKANIENARRQADDLMRQQRNIQEGTKTMASTSGAARSQMARQIGDQKDAMGNQLGQLQRDLDNAVRGMTQDPATQRRVKEAADAIRDHQIPDNVRISRQMLGVNYGNNAQVQQEAERAIADGLSAVQRKLDEAANGQGRNPNAQGDRQQQTSDRLRDLTRTADTRNARLQDRMQGGRLQGQQPGQQQPGQQGQPGQGQQGDQQGQGQSQQGQGQGQNQQARNGQGQGQGQGQNQQGQQQRLGQGQGQGQGQQPGQGQGQGQQARAQQGQGQGQGGGQGQPNGQQAGQGGQGGRPQGQQAGQPGQQNGQGGGANGGDFRNGSYGGRVGDYAGGGYYGGRDNQLGWGGWFNAPPLTAEEVRQYRAEGRQLYNDVSQLRAQLRNTPGIDQTQIEDLLRMLRQLDDEKIYKDANELTRLNSAVSEALKHFDYAFRRQTAEQNAVALSGSDEIPDGQQTLVEEYYRTLSKPQR
jgi:hypothetical protein